MRERYIRDKYYLAVFDSKNHAMQLYQHLRKNKLYQFELVATPCRIRTGCSYSIRFLKLEDYEILLNEASAINKKIAAVYEAEKVNRNRVLRELDFNQ